MDRLKKLLKLMKEHKGLSLLGILVLILIIILFVIFIELVHEKNTDKYGTRLEGIEEVELNNKDLNKIEKKIKENSEVDKVSIRVQGKIIYVNIKVNNSSSLDKAKEMANGSLTNFSEEEQSFYDICFFLTQTDDDNKDTNEFAVTGTKNAKLNDITWIKS